MPAINFAACATISQRFLQESGRIGPETYTRGRESDPLWLGLIEQKPWHDNMGLVVSNTVYQRSGLTTPPAWQTMVNSDGANVNGCIPPLTVVQDAKTTQQYQRQWISLESNPLCLMDIVTSNQPAKAVQGFVDNLKGNATYVRKERVRSEYERLCGHKVIVAPGLPEDSVAFPLVQATSRMTMGVLRRTYRQLQRESDGTQGVNKIAMGSRNNENFVYVSSGETIENLVKADGNIRDDFRWSTRVNELLGSYTDKFSYGGFVMWEESFPPRYNWTGSDYARVPEFTGSATTIGTKLEVNPAWNNAQFEVSYVFHPDVMCSRVEDPKATYGDVTYRAQNYALEWRWVNEYDRNCNPDNLIGFFRAIGIHASEPIFSQFGWAFLSLKCDVALDLVGCSSGSGYGSTGVYSGPDSIIN
jgi:hypothetical protein